MFLLAFHLLACLLLCITTLFLLNINGTIIFVFIIWMHNTSLPCWLGSYCQVKFQKHRYPFLVLSLPSLFYEVPPLFYIAWPYSLLLLKLEAPWPHLPAVDFFNKISNPEMFWFRLLMSNILKYKPSNRAIKALFCSVLFF